MKKTSLALIIAIFVLPIALYYFLKMPDGNDYTSAKATQGMARVLQFTSTMCYDCKRIEKEIAPLRTAPEYKNAISFEKINISQRTPAVDQLIQKYDVSVVPTLVFLDKHGVMQSKIQGYTTQAELKKCLDRIK